MFSHTQTVKRLNFTPPPNIAKDRKIFSICKLKSFKQIRRRNNATPHLIHKGKPYTLKRKCITSPSFTTYSLPSIPIFPAARTAASVLYLTKSS